MEEQQFGYFKSPNPLEQLEQPIPIPTVETDGLSLIDWLFPICEICSKRHFILQNKKITSKHVCRSCYFMFDINSEKRLNLVKQVRYNVVKKIKENCYDN
jgi:late competence protein required for DNA uptake (superfamily II DNA/RNA helicase)